MLFMANTTIFKLQHCIYRMKYHVGFNGTGSKYRCEVHFFVTIGKITLNQKRWVKVRCTATKLIFIGLK